MSGIDVILGIAIGLGANLLFAFLKHLYEKRKSSAPLSTPSSDYSQETKPEIVQLALNLPMVITYAVIAGALMPNLFSFLLLGMSGLSAFFIVLAFRSLIKKLKYFYNH